MLDCFILPYSYHRIKQIFRDEYNYSLERIYIYKGSRYGKPNLYKLVDSDGNTVLANITLQALRAYLTAEGYSLSSNK